MMFQRFGFQFALCILFLGFFGCGEGTDSKPLPKTVPASGVVTLDGKPRKRPAYPW